MYQCSVCDKEFEHAGAKNLHQRWCNLLRIEKEQKEKGQEVPKKQIVKCEHEWVLLGNTQAEKVARANGYTKYCGKCEECE